MKWSLSATCLVFITTATFLVSTSIGCSGGDLSTPKGAAEAFAKAMANGDGEGAKKASTGGDPKMVESMAAAIGSMKKLQDAAVAKFGDSGKTLGNSSHNFDSDMNVADAEVKINGDAATLTRKTDGKPLNLKKVNGEWKVDLAAMMGPMAAMGTTMFDGMGKAARETTDEINAGKYKTADEAKQAMGMKMMGGMFGGMKDVK